MSFAASVRGNDVFVVLMLIVAVAGVAYSTLFTVRTYRRLAQHQFSREQMLRYMGVILAFAVNGVVTFMIAAYMIIVLGVLVTGRGMVG